MGLTFKDLNLKDQYSPESSELLGHFYIPALGMATRYKRLAGFFSSTSLAAAAIGMKKFIRNGGKMQLVTSVVLSQQDKEAMEKGLDPKEMAGNFLKELDGMGDNDYRKLHVKVLGWMIKNKQLEIKIANVPKQRALFHMKIGILEDENNPEPDGRPSAISFNGSVNETEYGWKHNSEFIDIMSSWDEGKRWQQGHYDEFNKYWTGSELSNSKVYELPKAIEDGIIKIAPENAEKLDEVWERAKTSPKPFTPYPHQTEAVDTWVANDHKGIFAMATGAGKTRAALMAVQRDTSKKKIVLIVVPTTPLQLQWQDEIRSVEPEAEIILAGGNATEDWRDRNGLFSKVCALYKSGPPSSVEARIYIIAIQATASTKNKDQSSPAYGTYEFVKMFDGIDSSHVQFIGDEVHHLGSKEGQQVFKIPCDRRVGLSATHIRYFDDEGTQQIEDFFGRSTAHPDAVVGTLAIKDAIPKFLCRYEYYPTHTSVSITEFNEWHELTKEIGKSFAIRAAKLRKNPHASTTVDDENIFNLRLDRAKLLKNRIAAKKSTFEEIINEIDSAANKQVLVFCDDMEQQEIMTDVLNALPRSNRAYGSHLKKFENREALRLFKAKHVPYLVAMKALDEGLDVPECDTCILVASDATSRVYIQRRGRILRNPKEMGYKLAKIYDMFLLPPRLTGTDYFTYYDSTKSLLEHEIHRLKILAEAAQNLTDISQKMQQLLQTYVIYHLKDDNEPANCSNGKYGNP